MTSSSWPMSTLIEYRLILPGDEPHKRLGGCGSRGVIDPVMLLEIEADAFIVKED
jgi:hypothetical protein